MSVRWYVKVKTPSGGTETACFYHYPASKNPLEDIPERFNHSFEDLDEDYKYYDDLSDVREIVDELDEDTDYWIFDAHDDLGEFFPSVPDVPGHDRPTYFVGVPRNCVIDVFNEHERET